MKAILHPNPENSGLEVSNIFYSGLPEELTEAGIVQGAINLGRHWLVNTDAPLSDISYIVLAPELRVINELKQDALRYRSAVSALIEESSIAASATDTSDLLTDLVMDLEEDACDRESLAHMAVECLKQLRLYGAPIRE